MEGGGTVLFACFAYLFHGILSIWKGELLQQTFPRSVVLM